MSMTLHRTTPQRSMRRQGGAVLITGMIFLIVLTMFVLAMVRGGTTEERIARNARDQQVALQAAESMLRYAESTLFNSSPFDPYVGKSFTAACTGGLCYRPTSDWRALAWDNAALTKTFVNTSEQITGLNTQPSYIVEIVKVPVKTGSAVACQDGLATVTARGVANGGAVAYVQSTVRFDVSTNICD